MRTLHARARLGRVKPRHNEAPRCPSVRLRIFFSLCSLHHCISLCFQVLSKNPCMSSSRCEVSTGELLQRVTVKHGERVGRPGLLSFLKSAASVQFSNHHFGYRMSKLRKPAIKWSPSYSVIHVSHSACEVIHLH